jgi:hypothetical protein
MRQGVPVSAIVIPEGEAVGTLEELQAVWEVVDGANREGIGVRSEELLHKDRKAESALLAIASPDAPHTINARNAERNHAANGSGRIENPKSKIQNGPVILVTSKYHTRRTRLIWQYVSGGRSKPIVRAAADEPFDHEQWWRTRSYALAVVREYLGLLNYYAGFPVTP